jgi:hypothetical protein
MTQNRSQWEDHGAVYTPVQIVFHRNFSTAFGDWSFPDCEPLGEWFVMDRQTHDNVTKLSVSDCQIWGFRPSVDLLELARRRKLLLLSKASEREVSRYLQENQRNIRKYSDLARASQTAE